MLGKSILLFLFLIIPYVSKTAVYQRFFVKNTNAVCLDGTPSAYYISNGDPNKVIIYLNGGGWCGEPSLSATLQSCYQRSFTDLGSSSNYQQYMNWDTGLMSLEDGNNFKDWMKVIIPYCDGSGHQGSRLQPVEYKNRKLYFRGQDIKIATFNQLEQKLGIFTKVDNLILNGASAGGLAVYFWANYLRKNSKATNVWAVPDSGIFLNEKDVNGQYSYQESFINLMKLSNQQTSHPVSECAQQFPNQLYKCMFAENLYPFITTPLFNIQSQYDTWCIPNILHINCLADSNLSPCSESLRSIIEDYHQKVFKLLNTISTKEGNGAWAPVCANHCYMFYSDQDNLNFRIPARSQFSMNQSLKRWVNNQPGENHRRIEEGNWPNNRPCSGLPQSLTIQS